MIETLTLVQDRGRLLIRNPRWRRLGSLFPVARRGYLFGMPTALMLSGFVCLILQTDLSFIFGAIVASVISIYLVFDLLMRSAPLRYSTVLAFTLGLGYGLGSVNTWLTLPRAGESLGSFLGLSTPLLSQAIGGLLLAMGLLLAVGELYEKPVFGEEFRLNFNNRMILLLTLGTLFRVAMIVSGKAVGFSEIGGNASSGHVSPLATLAGDVQNPLFSLTVCAALNARGRVMRWYLYGMTAVLFLTAFPLGRRFMIYSVLLGLIAVRIGNYRLPFSVFKQVVLVVVAGAVLYVATLGFYYFRIAAGTLTNPTLFQRVSAVVQLVKEGKGSKVQAEFAQNVEGRTFVIGFLSELLGYSELLPTAHGQDFISQAELAIPSVLYPGKNTFFSEEGLAGSIFNTVWPDQANSVLTAGTVDFGFFGLLIYPLLAIFIIRLFTELFSQQAPPFISCFVVLFLIGSLIEPETNLTDYLVTIRESLLVGIAFMLLLRLPLLRIGNRTL